MNKEDLLLAIQSLIDETYGQQGHYIWINGQAVMLKKIIKETTTDRIDIDNTIISTVIKMWAEEELRKLAKEFEETKSLVPMYSKFGG